MWAFGTYCDEFHVASHLSLKLALEPSREALLHFLEVVRRAYPQLVRFRRREDASVLLEEEGDGADAERRSYLRLDRNALRLGHGSPADAEAVTRMGRVVFTQAPYDLSLSDLDYEFMEVAFGFDLEYRGNHDELVAETLMAETPLTAAMNGAGKRIIDCQPFIGIALSDDCTTQAYIEIKSRTSTYEIRVGEYEGAALGVCVTVRRYWGFDRHSDLVTAHGELVTAAEQLAASRVVPLVVQPLAAAIASRR